ncbi:MAG: 1-deoxy-D-xylulose-5-phosphate synthase [Robiginitomaculum sp.]|nr:MAG: 1-deoxy-D-xylulose-5-phosphate synthase [Robiginitomaculum sp.]
MDIEDALSHYNTELDKQNADAEQPWIMPSRTNLKSRIMYIECKEGEENGVANIGRVFFSKTGKTIYYDNKKFHSSKGRGIYGNYRDVDTGDEYWISGPKKDRNDRLFGGQKDVIIDNDIADEYFQLISK